MTDLAAIVRATRRSAKAIERMQQANRLANEQFRAGLDTSAAAHAYARASRAYDAAQAVLRANPLPSDCVMRAMEDEQTPLPDTVAAAWKD